MDQSTNDPDANDIKKWRTDPVDNKNILNKIGGDIENSMSSMSGSEDDEESKQQDLYNLMKKKSSKKSDENYDVKSNKMAMSESAKSRRSQFKRSNAGELVVNKKSTFQRQKEEDEDNEAIANMDDDSDGSFFDEDDK